MEAANKIPRRIAETPPIPFVKSVVVRGFSSAGAANSSCSTGGTTTGVLARWTGCRSTPTGCGTGSTMLLKLNLGSIGNGSRMPTKCWVGLAILAVRDDGVMGDTKAGVLRVAVVDGSIHDTNRRRRGTENQDFIILSLSSLDTSQ